MRKPRLDTSTDQGLNAATVLAAFELAGLDLKFRQDSVPDGVSLAFQWRENAHFRGHLHSEGTSIAVSLFLVNDAKAMFKHSAKVDSVEARVALGKEMQRALRYMGFRGRKD